MKSYYVLVLMVFSLGYIAQRNQMPVTFFDYGKKLPERILSNNSAVFIAQIDDTGVSVKKEKSHLTLAVLKTNIS